MTTYNRRGLKWTTNECLQLEREYELLGLSIDEIATRHQRTPEAIMFKLDQEEIVDYNTVYENYYNSNNQVLSYDLNNTLVSNNLSEEEEEEDDEEDEEDRSSNYSDDKAISEVSDDETCDTVGNLKERVVRLEKQVIILTEMLMKQNGKNKSIFSLFA